MCMKDSDTLVFLVSHRWKCNICHLVLLTKKVAIFSDKVVKLAALELSLDARTHKL